MLTWLFGNRERKRRPRPRAAERPQPQPQTQVHRAIFFREGAGYLFLKTLGHGVDGSASLVRNVHNDCIYVRKEMFRFKREHGIQYQSPPKEAKIASGLAHIPGVYQARGWSKWADLESHHNGFVKVMSVTYWKYYNMGALESFAPIEQRHNTPEVFLCHWLRTMLTVLIDVHDAGIVHNDAHVGNWLLDLKQDSLLPDVILADFSRAGFRGNYGNRDWITRCAEDFEMCVRNVAELLCLREDRGLLLARSRRSQCSTPLLNILRTFLRFLGYTPDSLRVLNRGVRMTRHQIEQHIEGVRIPSIREYHYREAADFGEYRKAESAVLQMRRGFKQFLIAEVELPGPPRQGVVRCLGVGDICPYMIRMAQGDYTGLGTDPGKYRVVYT